MSTTSPPRRPRPTASELTAEVRHVIADLPRFATAPLYRSWHQRWGAMDTEVEAPMPGDDIIKDVAYESTRAITIYAPPEEVWPWLVQAGCLRAGFYANDLLDNLAHPSAWAILPEYQHLEVGQWVPMSPTPSDVTAFKVAGFEQHRWLLWQQPLSTWSWLLTPLPKDGTRLVTRLRIHLDWNHRAMSFFSVILNEFGDFPMMRRMLLGIRDRAEAAHADTAGIAIAAGSAHTDNAQS
jgi:hypothetical protein